MNQPLSREVEIEPAHTALLVVDVQNYNCTWDGGEYTELSVTEKEQRYGFFFRTLRETALPNIVSLRQACRRARIEVTYTLIESLTSDGRDRSLDYKISGFNVPKGSPDARMVEELEITHPNSSVSAVVTVSSGVAFVRPTLERSPQGAITLADRGLYAAKRAGRNQSKVLDRDLEAITTGVFATIDAPFAKAVSG